MKLISITFAALTLGSSLTSVLAFPVNSGRQELSSREAYEVEAREFPSVELEARNGKEYPYNEGGDGKGHHGCGHHGRHWRWCNCCCWWHGNHHGHGGSGNGGYGDGGYGDYRAGGDGTSTAPKPTATGAKK